MWWPQKKMCFGKVLSLGRLNLTWQWDTQMELSGKDLELKDLGRDSGINSV